MQLGSEDEENLIREAASLAAGGDRAGEEAAVDRLLEAEPRSLRAHLMKADCRARAGDEPLAIHFYRTALRLAEDRELPREALDEVRRAKEALARLEASAHAKRESRLAARGLPPEKWSRRLRQSLEHAAGRRRLYLQEPTAFNYLELPHRQFYDPSEFDWAPAVESATGAIREELLRLLERGDEEFRAYIQNSTVSSEANRALLGKKDWSILALCEQGWITPDVIQRCPSTWQTVLQAPLPRISGWGPTVVFSMLKAGAHIAPHSGMFNTRLICHLPLIVPPGCRFRVGSEVREWQEGKLLIFDDTIEHEAWNDGPDDRVVLIFDIWRPELSEQEKYELTALFSD